MGKIALEFWFFFLPVFEGTVKNFIFPHSVIFLFNIDEWLNSEPSFMVTKSDLNLLFFWASTQGVREMGTGTFTPQNWFLRTANSVRLMSGCWRKQWQTLGHDGGHQICGMVWSTVTLSAMQEKRKSAHGSNTDISHIFPTQLWLCWILYDTEKSILSSF